MFQLEAGDIILAINEREVVKLSTKEVLKCLRLSGDIVNIKFKRGTINKKLCSCDLSEWVLFDLIMIQGAHFERRNNQNKIIL